QALPSRPTRRSSDLGPDGQDMIEHLTEKYGSTEAEQEQSREALRQRGAALGFNFEMGKRSRIYNTFDAHRLLHWAEAQGRQRALDRKSTRLNSSHQI